MNINNPMLSLMLRNCGNNLLVMFKYIEKPIFSVSRRAPIPTLVMSNLPLIFKNCDLFLKKNKKKNLTFGVRSKIVFYKMKYGSIFYKMK